MCWMWTKGNEEKKTNSRFIKESHLVLFNCRNIEGRNTDIYFNKIDSIGQTLSLSFSLSLSIFLSFLQHIRTIRHTPRHCVCSTFILITKFLFLIFFCFILQNEIKEIANKESTKHIHITVFQFKSYRMQSFSLSHSVQSSFFCVISLLFYQTKICLSQLFFLLLLLLLLLFQLHFHFTEL